MWILDVSVVVKWFFTDEPLREKAIELRDVLVEKPLMFAVPHLFYSELIHVLSKKSGKKVQFVQEALDLVLSFGLPTVFLTKEGLSKAVQYSCEGLSGYDATYVALANQLKARWVTSDSQAVKNSPIFLAVELSSWAEEATS
jgi:predicted nucleic acid-binding protein